MNNKSCNHDLSAKKWALGIALVVLVLYVTNIGSSLDAIFLVDKTIDEMVSAQDAQSKKLHREINQGVDQHREKMIQAGKEMEKNRSDFGDRFDAFNKNFFTEMRAVEKLHNDHIKNFVKDAQEMYDHIMKPALEEGDRLADQMDREFLANLAEDERKQVAAHKRWEKEEEIRQWEFARKEHYERTGEWLPKKPPVFTKQR